MMRPGTGLGIAASIPAKPCITNDMGPPIFMPCELFVCVCMYITLEAREESWVCFADDGNAVNQENIE